MDLGRDMGIGAREEDVKDEATIGVRRICWPNNQCPATHTHTHTRALRGRTQGGLSVSTVTGSASGWQATWLGLC